MRDGIARRGLIGNELRARPVMTQPFERGRARHRIDEGKMADSARRDADETFAERRRMKSIFHDETLAASLIFAGETASAFTMRS